MTVIIAELKRIRDYFLEHDKSPFEHHCYNFLNNLIDRENSKSDVEPLGYTSEAVQKGGIDEIVNNICKELHEDSEIEIKIEAGYAGITLYHKLEKIGDYDTSESLPTIGDVLKYVIGREKHLH